MDGNKNDGKIKVRQSEETKKPNMGRPRPTAPPAEGLISLLAASSLCPSIISITRLDPVISLGQPWTILLGLIRATDYEAIRTLSRCSARPHGNTIQYPRPNTKFSPVNPLIIRNLNLKIEDTDTGPFSCLKSGTTQTGFPAWETHPNPARID